MTGSIILRRPWRSALLVGHGVTLCVSGVRRHWNVAYWPCSNLRLSWRTKGPNGSVGDGWRLVRFKHLSSTAVIDGDEHPLGFDFTPALLERFGFPERPCSLWVKVEVLW